MPRTSTSTHSPDIGAVLAQTVEPVIARLAEDGQPDTRCVECAFRVGTRRNRSQATQLDALKCVLEGLQFLCHMQVESPCHGWVAARVAARGWSIRVPWGWSQACPGAPSREDTG
jgi:hypothetical protein